MIELRLHGMPVLASDGSYRGVLMRRDLVDRGDDLDFSAIELCRKAKPVGPDLPLDELVDLLQRNRLRAVPVMVGEEVVGLVSAGQARKLLDAAQDIGPAFGGFSSEIASEDRMFSGDRAAYFAYGASALAYLRRALPAAGVAEVRSILDFGCGHGRVLRALKAAFPGAELTACDLDEDAVRFCVEKFGARPVISRSDPALIEIPGTFDLIWCGSVLTHADAPLWPRFLELFASRLRQPGTLVFSSNQWDAVVAWRGVGERWTDPIREGYESSGFGYVEAPGEAGYGLCASKPEWVQRLLGRQTGLGVVDHLERGWGGVQDLWTCALTE
jgi:SAM-dependent methyltransferase